MITAPRKLAGTAGQAGIEYLGVIVVSAIVVLTIAASAGALGSQVTDAIQRSICQLVDGENCGTAESKPVVPIDAVVDPNAPRPESNETSADTQFAVYGGGGETCFADSNGCASPEPGQIPEVVPPDPNLCEEGDLGNGQILKCDLNGLPILDLDYDGINDFEDPFYTTEDGEDLPWYEPTGLDVNGNGIPDGQEPGDFTYRNRLYRPGQEGVYCEQGDSTSELFCAPAPELFGRVVREQNSSLLGILERASLFVPIPGGFLAKVGGKLAGPLIKLGAGKAEPLFKKAGSLLSKLKNKLRPGAATTLPDDVVQLARSHVTDSGETVIGHYEVKGYPSYIETAQNRGASYFDLGPRYDELSEAQQRAANFLFLDEAAARGDRVTLSHPFSEVRGDTALADEIDYLRNTLHYTKADDHTLLPP